MSAADPLSKLRESAGPMRAACPLHGCRRVYSDRSALDTHIREHDSPAQSVPGKVLLCSAAGCSSSFPTMKKLMEHMRQHHKPNIYFLCESCRTKLRSYRGLLTHLHTCSKAPRGRPKPPGGSSPSPTAGAAHQNPPQPDPMSQPREDLQTPGSDSSAPQADCAAVPHGPAAVPGLDLQPEVKKTPPDPAPPAGAAAAPDLPESRVLAQAPAPALAPRSPPAVWKKSQGGLVLWEHTKGRYVCVLCGHVVSNRPQMMQHASTHNRAAEHAGKSAPKAPLPGDQ